MKTQKILNDYSVINNISSIDKDLHNQIFSHCIIAIGICSEIAENIDFGEVIRDILSLESNFIETEYNPSNEVKKISNIAIDNNNFHKLRNNNIKINKIINIGNFYIDNCMLKTKVERDLLDWDIDFNELETVSKHIYNSCMLALIINKYEDIDIDINKVLKLLMLHKENEIFPNEPINTLVKNLNKKDEIISLINEYNLNESKEAKFANNISNLELSLQSIIYENKGYKKYNNKPTEDFKKILIKAKKELK